MSSLKSSKKKTFTPALHPPTPQHHPNDSTRRSKTMRPTNSAPPIPTQEPTAEYGWASRTEEVKESRWMKDERGTSIQPPWTYFANFDLYDSASMKRLARYMHYHLNGIDGTGDVTLWASNKEEMREMKRMCEESFNNPLLTDMLVWFSTFHESSERIVSLRASELCDIVNYTIRHPEIYKVGYQKERKEWNKKGRRGAPSRAGLSSSRKSKATEKEEEEEEEEESPQLANRRNYARKHVPAKKKRGRKAKVKPVRTTQARICDISSESSEEEGEEEDEEEEEREQDEQVKDADQDSLSEAHSSEEDLDDGDTYAGEFETLPTTLQPRRKSILSPLGGFPGRKRKAERMATSPESDLLSTASTTPIKPVLATKKSTLVKTDLPLEKRAAAKAKTPRPRPKDVDSTSDGIEEEVVSYNVFNQTVIEGRGRTTRSGRGYNQYTTDGFRFEGHVRFDTAAPATSSPKGTNMGPPARPGARKKSSSVSTRSSRENTPSESRYTLNTSRESTPNGKGGRSHGRNNSE